MPRISEFDWAQLVSPGLAELTAYQTQVAPCVVRLDANEAAAFLSEEGRAELAEAAARIA